MMRLSALLAGYVDLSPKQDVIIQGMALDSRRVQSGDLFFAYEGSQKNGEAFIKEAVTKGAGAVVVEKPPNFEVAVPVVQLPNLKRVLGVLASRFYQEPSQKLTVIGVTGTNGKTSVSYFLAQTLHRLGRRVAVLGTVGNGVYPTLAKSALTTLDPVRLQQQLSQFVDEKVDAVVMEVSSHALAQHRVAGVQFDIGVFTNLSRDHLDYHGSMAAYAAAKGLLWQQQGMRYAVINVDDAIGRDYLASLPHSLMPIPYGLSASANVKGEILASSEQGFQLVLHISGQRVECVLPLMGEFNVMNALAVVGCLQALGVSIAEYVPLLSQLKPPPGRMEAIHLSGKPLVVVDYAHTPDALAKTLQTLRLQCQSRILCVFGCGGERDVGKRALMGEQASCFADVVILTNDNPRGEDPMQIVQDILAGVGQIEKAQIELDRAKAIQCAIEQASSDDVVLIAGKGHEDYQLVAGHCHPFDDRKIAKQCLSSS